MAVRPPLGQQVHLALVENGADAAVILAKNAGHPDLFDRVHAVATQSPAPNFLHSALCAMSLPVRRPPDEHAPIIRQDGQYTLVITPKPMVTKINGDQKLYSLGVPYGSLPRLVLIHIMTEAVRTKSRHVVLGTSFTDWMRRMGFRTISYGPRGSATLIREQLDRLLACEWMIRWDNDTAQGNHEFGIREIKLTNEYVGIDRKSGGFMREIFMTEGFFDHLCEHAVPLNEHAIRQLRDSATALDLYTWLAYRLPRISVKRPQSISWHQLAVHFGNDGKNIRKFRQTIRDAWERHVSGVYPEAKAEFDTAVVKLYASPAPLNQTRVRGAQLSIVTDEKGTAPESVLLADVAKDPSHVFLKILAKELGPSDARAWLRGVTLERKGEAWVLLTETRFVAHWLSTHFDAALRKASRAAGFDLPPPVMSRPAKTH